MGGSNRTHLDSDFWSWKIISCVLSPPFCSPGCQTKRAAALQVSVPTVGEFVGVYEKAGVNKEQMVGYVRHTEAPLPLDVQFLQEHPSMAPVFLTENYKFEMHLP